jgi:RNA polymerase sigma factor (sigma-70 family)
MAEADNRLPPSGDSGTDIHRQVGLAAEVFSRYSDEIRAMIGFNVKDPSRADDIFQNLFISLVHDPIPLHVTDVKAYLYRIITNDVYDTFRRRKIHQESVEKYAEIHKHDAAHEDPQDSLIEAEETQQMLGVIERKLPKHQAMVVTQHLGNGSSVNNTAEKMHLSKRSVYKYLSAAKKKMRELIPENGGTSNDLS